MPTRLPTAALAALTLLLTVVPSPTAAQPGPGAERVTTPGDYTGHTVEEATVRLEAENATARITFPEAGVVRVDWTRPGAEPDTSYGVLPRSTPPDAPRVVETDSTLFVRSPAMTVTARKHPLRLRFADESGRTPSSPTRPARFASASTPTPASTGPGNEVSSDCTERRSTSTTRPSSTTTGRG